MTTAPPDRHSRADLRRKALVCVVVAASAAVMLYVLGLCVERTWVAYGALACLVAAAVSLRGRIVPEGPRPSAAEVALAAATATYTIAAVTFMWWIFYWLIRWALALVDSVASIGISEGRIAWVVTLVLFAPVLVAAAGRAAYEMVAELYPATGLRSRYRDVIRFRGRKLMWRTLALLAGLVALIAAAVALDVASTTVGTWLLIILVLTGSAFAVPAGGQRLGSVRAPDVKRVAESAEAEGWQVLANPQTGDAGIDPYLAEVDLFASKGQLAMLAKVVQGDPGAVAEDRLDPIGWPIVATVLTAARSLPPSQLPEGVESVEPVLVLLGAELQSEPLLFATQNGVALLSVGPDGAAARARTVPRLEQELQAIGERLRPGAAREAAA